MVLSSVIAPIVFFSTQRHTWSSNPIVYGQFQELLYLPEFIIFEVKDSVSRGWNNYITNSQASRQNELYKKELLILKTELYGLRSAKEELNSLRKSLKFSERFQEEHVLAQVVAPPIKTPFHAIRINKGQSAGVEIGMPVVNMSGVIGRVVRAGYFYSDIQLITDPNFSLDILSERTRIRGTLNGHPSGRVTLNLQKKANLKVGDTLVTSGALGNFPKGLPVGSIAQIRFDSDDVTQKVFAEPWVDERKIDEVIVIKVISKNLKGIINTAGKYWIETALPEIKNSKG